MKKKFSQVFFVFGTFLFFQTVLFATIPPEQCWYCVTSSNPENNVGYCNPRADGTGDDCNSTISLVNCWKTRKSDC